MGSNNAEPPEVEVLDDISAEVLKSTEGNTELFEKAVARVEKLGELAS